MSTTDNTIVTACDSRYLWGALLLALSARKEGSDVPIHVLHSDLSKDEVDMLEQLPDVRCMPARSPYAMFQKPEALLSADTAWATWMDSDVIWRGDLTRLLAGSTPGIQIRVRGNAENSDAFRGATNGDEGTIPSEVLSRWKEDIQELDQPRLNRMAVTNVIALHRDFRWLPGRWHELMERVSLRPEKLVDRDNTAYRITDEAALTALLAFSRDAVPVLPYRLNEDPARLLIHFADRPKPWTGWQLRYVKHYQAVAAVVAWAIEAGYRLPPIPDALQPEQESRFQRRARVSDIKLQIRRRILSGVRRLRASS